MKYKVLTPLLHDGKKLEVNSEVELSEEQAKALIEAMAVEASESKYEPPEELPKSRLKPKTGE